MSRPDPKTPRRHPRDQDAVGGTAHEAEADAAAEILAMLTSRRVDPEQIFDADGTPLSVSPFERRAMWF